MFAYFAIGPTEMLVVLFVTLISLVLPAWLAWKVSLKAGFPGTLGLLVVVPLGFLVFLYVLAFRPWPRMSRE
jgi:hypothetical protein